MDELGKVINTIANRVKSDVKVQVKLSCIIGDLNSDDIELPAIKTILSLFKEHLEESARRPVYTYLRELLKDSSAIAIHLENKGFSIVQLKQELDAIKEVLSTVEFQPPENPFIVTEIPLGNLTLTDEGLLEVPLGSISDLPIIKFKEGSEIFMDNSGNIDIVNLA